MTYAVLFPGQGSQFVGMGEDLFSTRPEMLGDRAEEILGWSLRSMCLEGPEDQLTRTEHAQPALYALSYAMWDVFEEQVGELPVGGAGHSLGEYTALTAAGVISFEDGLAVVAERGRAMAKAADSQPSGMAALIGANAEIAESIAATRRSDGGRLQVANINAPGQVVVAGSIVDIEWVTDNAGELGVRRAIPLKVAGAFHSSYMNDAATDLATALSRVRFSDPRFPVWSNTTARPHRTEELVSTLCDQVVSPVRFQETLEDIAKSVSAFVHIGPGDVTAGMAKRTVKGADVRVVSSPADLDAIADLVTIG